jgi:hypothetical protein
MILTEKNQKQIKISISNKFSLTFHTDKPNLQIALLVSEEAKKADRARQYQDAIDLYNEALERFLLVYNGWLQLKK